MIKRVNISTARGQDHLTALQQIFILIRSEEILIVIITIHKTNYDHEYGNFIHLLNMYIFFV